MNLGLLELVGVLKWNIPKQQIIATIIFIKHALKLAGP